MMAIHVVFNDTSWHRLPLYMCYEKSDGTVISMQWRFHDIAMGLLLPAVFGDTNPWAWLVGGVMTTVVSWSQYHCSAWELMKA